MSKLGFIIDFRDAPTQSRGAALKTIKEAVDKVCEGDTEYTIHGLTLTPVVTIAGRIAGFTMDATVKVHGDD